MDALALALTAAAMIMFAFAASGRELRRFNEIALGLVFLSAALIGQFTSVTARTSAADRTRYTLGGRRREVRGAGVREAAEPAAGADDPGEPAAVRILRTAYPAGRERDRAVRWLVWIAAHQGDRRNLAWWDIAAWVGEPGLRFARTLTGAVLLGLALGLGFGAYLGSRGLAAGPLAAIAAAYIGSKLRPGKLRRSRPPRAMVPRWPPVRAGRRRPSAGRADRLVPPAGPDHLVGPSGGGLAGGQPGPQLPGLPPVHRDRRGGLPADRPARQPGRARARPAGAGAPRRRAGRVRGADRAGGRQAAGAEAGRARAAAQARPPGELPPPAAQRRGPASTGPRGRVLPVRGPVGAAVPAQHPAGGGRRT